MVIEHYLNHRNIISHQRGYFIHIHAEASVSRHVDDRFIRTAAFCSHGGAQSVSHGSQPSGSDQRSGNRIFKILGRPHLMLSHIGTDQGISARNTVNFLYCEGSA